VSGVGYGGDNFTSTAGGNGEIAITYAVTPAPDSLAVFASGGLGALGILLRRRRRA
jgi:hypothetical protein